MAGGKQGRRLTWFVLLAILSREALRSGSDMGTVYKKGSAIVMPVRNQKASKGTRMRDPRSVFPFLLLLLGLIHASNGGDIGQLAHDYAPYLRFDSEAGDSGKCFPHNAQDFYATRKAGDWSRQCNTDYNSVVAGNIPTYWHAMICGYHLHIAYWHFYGYNDDCDCCSGERDAWWEFIVVKIRDWDLSPHLHEVMFGQKKGWYTRIPGHYETFNVSHPVAYVGKSHHGTFHDDGGTGTCCYYEDFRNPGSPNQYMKTWENLIEMKQESGEEWMSDPGTDFWHGLQSPIYRSDWDLCGLVGCTGSNLQVCGTCGCHKSDIDDDPF